MQSLWILNFPVIYLKKAKFALAPRKLVLDENTSEIQDSSYFCLKA